MIVADTGAIVALIDADDEHHSTLRSLYARDPEAWILPWAILPEVDYLLAEHVGEAAQAAFLADLAEGRYWIEWSAEADLARAREVHEQHQALRLGLVDSVVVAVAERLGAHAIATLDVRDFGALPIAGSPLLLPRDLP